MIKVVYIKTFFDNMSLPYTVEKDMEIKKGEWYLINTRFGEDIGISVTGLMDFDSKKFHSQENKSRKQAPGDVDDIEIDDHSVIEEKEDFIPVGLEHNQVLRLARPDEIEQREELKQEAKEAYEKTKKEIEDLRLEMKLINVHFLVHRKKIIFNFTAENRIDFRQLVKRLAGIFKTRIEMRQIGVRDAAKILGGYGICGCQCCCTASNCHMNSIYLKMAKDQGFLVNSSKLTGVCGRLMCCLAYENDFYLSEKKKYPENGSFIEDEQHKYRIVSVNMIKNEICAFDSHHQQKKYEHDKLKFQRKDKDGIAIYHALQNKNKEN